MNRRIKLLILAFVAVLAAGFFVRYIAQYLSQSKAASQQVTVLFNPTVLSEKEGEDFKSIVTFNVEPDKKISGVDLRLRFHKSKLEVFNHTAPVVQTPTDYFNDIVLEDEQEIGNDVLEYRFVATAKKPEAQLASSVVLAFNFHPMGAGLDEVTIGPQTQVVGVTGNTETDFSVANPNEKQSVTIEAADVSFVSSPTPVSGAVSAELINFNEVNLSQIITTEYGVHDITFTSDGGQGWATDQANGFLTALSGSPAQPGAPTGITGTEIIFRQPVAMAGVYFQAGVPFTKESDRPNKKIKIVAYDEANVKIFDQEENTCLGAATTICPAQFMGVKANQNRIKKLEFIILDPYIYSFNELYIYKVRDATLTPTLTPTLPQTVGVGDTTPPTSNIVYPQENGEITYKTDGRVCALLLAPTDNVTSPTQIQTSFTFDSDDWSAYRATLAYACKDVLFNGPHILKVRSRDEAGNVETPPLVRNFTVNIPGNNAGEPTFTPTPTFSPQPDMANGACGQYNSATNAQTVTWSWQPVVRNTNPPGLLQVFELDNNRVITRWWFNNWVGGNSFDLNSKDNNNRDYLPPNIRLWARVSMDGTNFSSEGTVLCTGPNFSSTPTPTPTVPSLPAGTNPNLPAATVSNDTTITVPADCFCQASGICTSACNFEQIADQSVYSSVMHCDLSGESSKFTSTPGQTQKDAWCQNSKRTKGDVNGDGGVDSQDLTLYLFLVAGGKGDPRFNPDVNGDREVGTIDLNIIGQGIQETQRH